MTQEQVRVLGEPRCSISLPAAAAAKLLQLCPTLCNLIDSSPPGSPVPGILQARTLEWIAISFSSAWKWSRSFMSDSSRLHGLQPTRLLRPWDFPGKSTGVGCHCPSPFLGLGGNYMSIHFIIVHQTLHLYYEQFCVCGLCFVIKMV